MLPTQRQQEILEMLGRDSTVVVREVAARLGVAESTVRRDLDALEAKGLVTRIFGGATLHEKSPWSLPLFDARECAHEAEKERIGQAAAALVADYEAIFVDSGTTTATMVPHLAGKRGLTVVTCDLAIALRLASVEGVTTVLIGGELHGSTLSCIGSLASRAMEMYDLYFTKSFIGVRGVSASVGLTNRAPERVAMKRLAIARAREVIVVADGSKVGTLAPFQVAPARAMHHLLTGESASPAELQALVALGIQVSVF